MLTVSKSKDVGFFPTLAATISEWEASHNLDAPEWDDHQCRLMTLEKMAIASGVIEATEWGEQISQLLNCERA